MDEKNIIQTLEDGLVLRSGTPDDVEDIVQFNGLMHVDPGEDFVEHIALWTRDLGSGKHPTAQASDFTLVEDTSTGKIVSTLCLIGQTWAYEGIEFPVGRPELVGTLADYRRRGLVRRQFEVIHQWSAERGQVLQFITGIPWYYRQFGYVMAVNLGGQRQGYLANIPALKKDAKEPFVFRRAEEKDLPFIGDLYQKASRRHLLACVRDAQSWQYELKTRTRHSSYTWDMWLIETPEGESVGYLFTVPTLYSGKVYVRTVELVDGISWFELAHPLLRHI
ncbi:MAG: GNAT family N-acetyltransferase, partial [Anaerolineales bacterium]